MRMLVDLTSLALQSQLNVIHCRGQPPYFPACADLRRFTMGLRSEQGCCACCYLVMMKRFSDVLNGRHSHGERRTLEFAFPVHQETLARDFSLFFL